MYRKKSRVRTPNFNDIKHVIERSFLYEPPITRYIYEIHRVHVRAPMFLVAEIKDRAMPLIYSFINGLLPDTRGRTWKVCEKTSVSSVYRHWCMAINLWIWQWCNPLREINGARMRYFLVTRELWQQLDIKSYARNILMEDRGWYHFCGINFVVSNTRRYGDDNGFFFFFFTSKFSESIFRLGDPEVSRPW